jgi:hypothetical protein
LRRDRRPQPAQLLLFAVCFIGACAGSTTSGIKTIHYVLICKFGVAAIKKIFFQPLSVLSVRVNGRRVDDLTIYLAVCYFIVNIFMVLAGGVLLTFLDDLDYLSAMSAMISALMNIGPGFGAIGPSENFAFFSDASKWFLAWNAGGTVGDVLGARHLLSVLLESLSETIRAAFALSGKGPLRTQQSATPPARGEGPSRELASGRPRRCGSPIRGDSRLRPHDLRVGSGPIGG